MVEIEPTDLLFIDNGLGASHEPGMSTGTLASASGWCDARSGRLSGAASASLTMIVRGEQDHPAKCLESVRGLFDEIIIVDTGSVDRTKEIAQGFGAKVFDFVWIDDFAAARNAALTHATTVRL
jgi:Glycosyl transferase family 2